MSTPSSDPATNGAMQVTASGAGMEDAAMSTGIPTEIHWLASLDEAHELARQQDKPILLDFFSPT